MSKMLYWVQISKFINKTFEYTKIMYPDIFMY